jgi:hypothetical protein
MNMVTMMKKTRTFDVEAGLYPWGKAVLTDSWVILHKHGDPKLAISYREKVTATKIAHQILGLRRNH